MGGGALKQCGLLHGTEYQFQVQVRFGAGHWSEWSIEKTGSTLESALESPVSINASLSDDHSLWIQWEAPKSLPVTGYVIEWCVVSETLPCRISFTLVQHNCTKTLITENIEPFKCYTISVYPKYKDGFGLPVSVEAYSKQRAPSKVPKLKVEDIGGSYAELAWDSVPVDERNGFIRSYTIFYSDKEGKTGMRVVDAPEMRVILENLKPSTEYKAFIMVSTDAGSLNGTALTLSTTILDHWTIISTILPVCISLTLFLVITALACFIKHDNLKLSIWPMVPDPANSSICKWTPPSTQKMNPRLSTVKDHSTTIFSQVNVLDVSTKTPEEKDQKQIRKAEEAGSQSRGNSSGLGESIQDSVFDSSSDDMSPRAYQNTPRVEYSSVICNGYKGQQNPKHLRSDSTQPLLHDLSPSPKQCENIFFQGAKEGVSKACQDEEPGEKVCIASWDDFPLLRGLMINEEVEKDSAP
ncbi:IL6RB protein, partial [Polyodon spathula]|nr:IL6RB protein [Polyodon spathula]